MPELYGEGEARPIDSAGGEALFRETLARFQRRVDANQTKALDRYGLTLFHSLPESVKTQLREQWGIGPTGAVTRYNRGCVAASKSEWARAMEEFQAALEMDEGLLEALFNLAVAREKSGDADGARESFERFVALAEADETRTEDVAKVTAYLRQAGDGSGGEASGTQADA